MAAGDQAVGVAMDGLARPVALGSCKVSGGASVESGHREHLRGREAVEVPAAGPGQQVF